MGIYSKTVMETIPQSCTECEFGRRYGFVGDVKCRILNTYFTGNVEPPYKERPDECPLIELAVAPNDPLTLEELREMVLRCEGVYIAHTDGSPVFRDQTYCAAVLDFRPTFGSTAMHIQAIYGDRLTMWEDDYDKTWIAYRRKPEEGTSVGG